ncbi:MAG: GNAT family N-acetyltransferase [Spirochaetia bacterium]|nr:GNAT family N-acetyltransferase [Spirochaetia bacterium]
METKRLRLRPFLFSDSARVALLAGDRKIAFNTATLPHPYEERMAVEWIARHETYRAEGTQYIYAMETKEDNLLVGTIGLVVNEAHRQAELGYWVGVPYWGIGYATEASEAMLDFAFRELPIQKVFARHFAANPASGRVMQKLGMKLEGRLREHLIRFEIAHDLVYYGILRDEYEHGR